MFSVLKTCSKLCARVYCGGRPLECDGADCDGDDDGGLELDPDDELAPGLYEEPEGEEFDELEPELELEPDDDEPDDDEPDDEPEFEELELPPDEPEPLPELDDDDPELWSELWWCEEPELPALRVSPASESPRCPPLPPPSCFGGLCATGGVGGGVFGGSLYGGLSGYFLSG